MSQQAPLQKGGAIYLKTDSKGLIIITGPPGAPFIENSPNNRAYVVSAQRIKELLAKGYGKEDLSLLPPRGR